MSLISMCIQMMQDQIVDKVRWVAEESGLVDSEARQQQRVRARRTRTGAVPETKEDQFGYRPLSGENRRRRRQRKEKDEQTTKADMDEQTKKADMEEQTKKADMEEQTKKDAAEGAGAERKSGGVEAEAKRTEPKIGGEEAKGRQPDEVEHDDEEDLLFTMA